MVAQERTWSSSSWGDRGGWAQACSAQRRASPRHQVAATAARPGVGALVTWPCRPGQELVP